MRFSPIKSENLIKDAPAMIAQRRRRSAEQKQLLPPIMSFPSKFLFFADLSKKKKWKKNFLGEQRRRSHQPVVRGAKMLGENVTYFISLYKRESSSPNKMRASQDKWFLLADIIYPPIDLSIQIWVVRRCPIKGQRSQK